MSRPKRMTQDEFNELCRRFRRGPKDNIERDMYERIVAASLKVIRHPMIKGRQLSRGGGSSLRKEAGELVAKFLDGCDQRQLGLLKKMAEKLISPKKWGEQPMSYPKTFTAHHEAGHAVINLRLGFDVAMVTIKPDPRRGSDGYVKSAASGRSWKIVDDVRIRLSDEWCEKYIKSALAGKIAEALINPDTPRFGWWCDWQRARKYARIICDTRQERNELLGRMQREATTLVLANTAAIERVAGALVERETLMRDEIAALVK